MSALNLRKFDLSSIPAKEELYLPGRLRESITFGPWNPTGHGRERRRPSTCATGEKGAPIFGNPT